MICRALCASLALLGFPVGQASAQAPQLLRAQERVISAQGCTELLAHITRLSDPQYLQDLRRPLDSLQRMVDAAKSDRAQAFEKAKEDAQDQAKKLGLKYGLKGAKSLGLNRLKDLRERVTMMRQLGEIKPGDAIEMYDKIDKAATRLDRLYETQSQLSKLDKFGRNLDATQKLAAQTKSDATSYLQALNEVNDIAVKGGFAEELGGLIASAGGPATETLWIAGNILLSVGLDLYEARQAGSFLSQYEENLATVRNQVLAVPIQVDNAQARYNRYCKLPVQKAEQEQPKPSPASTGSAVLLGTLAIAGGIGLAAAAAGGGGGSSSSGPKSCNSGQFCRTSAGKEGCCVNGGFIQLCQNSNACAHIDPFTEGSCPGEARVLNCCGGSVDCGINSH